MIASSILLLTVATTFACAGAISSNDVLSVKRGPMGFQGMRGKKNLASLEYDEFSKRAPMGFQGMRGKKDSITTKLENEVVLENADNKRAPMGFQGTRGKKGDLMSDFVDFYFPNDEHQRRSPMAFLRIGGKKTPPLEAEYYKRAPMGFQGMRGKKSAEEILNEIEKKATMEFQSVRSKETYLPDYPEDHRKRNLPIEHGVARDQKEEEEEEEEEEQVPEQWGKRAPMGFQGMRGKKTVLDAIEELEKRAVIGFRGMQGKRDTSDNYVDYSIDPFDYEKRSTDFQDTRGSESFKRARIGFHGMRGKRDTMQAYRPSLSISRTTMSYRGTGNRKNELATYEIEKRSPFRYSTVVLLL